MLDGTNNLKNNGKTFNADYDFTYLKSLGWYDALQKGIDEDFCQVVSAEVSLTERCNAACFFCVDEKNGMRSIYKGNINTDKLVNSMKLWKEKGLRAVVLEGGGEPTIHPQFNSIVERLYGLDLDLGLITNGIKSLNRDIIKKFCWIRISINAGSKESYRKILKVNQYDNVIKNAGNIAKTGIKCGFGVVQTSEGSEAYKQLVQKASEIGMSYIQFRPATEVTESDYWHDIEILRDYKSNYENDNFKVYIHDVQHSVEDNGGNAGLSCVAHSLTMSIANDGTLFHCCRIKANEKYYDSADVGNILTQTPDEIYENKKFKKWVSRSRDKDFCSKECPECRLTKYNVLINEMRKERPDKNFV